jgi:hypothetical protein
VSNKIYLRKIVKDKGAILIYQFSSKTYFKKTETYNPMKKIIYLLLFAFATSMSITSCTEEEVTPTSLTKASGGGHSDPK